MTTLSIIAPSRAPKRPYDQFASTLADIRALAEWAPPARTVAPPALIHPARLARATAIETSRAGWSFRADMGTL